MRVSLSMINEMTKRTTNNWRPNNMTAIKTGGNYFTGTQALRQA